MHDPRRLRVLQVVETLDVGGMERMVATLCRTLSREAFEVRVLVSKSIGAIGHELLSAGVTVECANIRSDKADYLASFRLIPFIRSFRPNVVHTHASHALLYGGLAARLCGVKRIVHTEHGRRFPDKAHLMLAERWMSRYLHRYVTVSEALYGQVQRFEGIARRRLEVIPNGVADVVATDPTAVASTRAKLGGQRTGPVVGITARLVWEKGLEYLLRAWAVVAVSRQASGNAPGTLLIAGDGPERTRLETLATDLGISDSIRFLGTISDTASFYRILDVFVLSSVSEGLPMSLLEAMAAGLPIVATEVGGIPEALDRGTAGLLVPPADTAALAAALMRFVGGHEPAADGVPRFGHRARQRFVEHYTANAMTDRYVKLYTSSREH